MDLVARGSKADRIRAILERGETIPAIRLSAGYKDADDTMLAETLAIALVNSVLKHAGLLRAGSRSGGATSPGHDRHRPK
jgi:hypothetical protein